MPVRHYVPESRLKKNPIDPYDWREYVPNEQTSQRGRIIQEKATQMERKARLKERVIKNSRREENIEDMQEINGRLVGALKAKLSIIDSFEL